MKKKTNMPNHIYQVINVSEKKLTDKYYEFAFLNKNSSLKTINNKINAFHNVDVKNYKYKIFIEGDFKIFKFNRV